MTEALIILGLLVVFGVACFLGFVALGAAMRLVGTRRREEHVQTDSPFTAETREALLMGGERVSFGDRMALCDQLDKIVALPEIDLPPIAEWERDV